MLIRAWIILSGMSGLQSRFVSPIQRSSYRTITVLSLAEFPPASGDRLFFFPARCSRPRDGPAQPVSRRPPRRTRLTLSAEFNVFHIIRNILLSEPRPQIGVKCPRRLLPFPFSYFLHSSTVAAGDGCEFKRAYTVNYTASGREAVSLGLAFAAGIFGDSGGRRALGIQVFLGRSWSGLGSSGYSVFDRGRWGCWNVCTNYVKLYRNLSHTST